MQNGDKVVYSKYAGTELKVQGADYVLLKVYTHALGLTSDICQLCMQTLGLTSDVCQLSSRLMLHMLLRLNHAHMLPFLVLSRYCEKLRSNPQQLSAYHR